MPQVGEQTLSEFSDCMSHLLNCVLVSFTVFIKTFLSHRRRDHFAPEGENRLSEHKWELNQEESASELVNTEILKVEV